MTTARKRGRAMARPAEAAGATAGLGGVIAGIADGNTLAAILAAVGFVPVVVTFVVVHGGLSGCWRLLWKGRS